MQLMHTAAGQPMVSGQITHLPGATQVDSVASFATGSTPTFTFNHFGSGASGLDAATSAFLSHLPKGIRPQGAATRESAPKTVADFTDSLWWWLESSPGIRTPPELFDAWQRYIRLTSQYAADHGLACARAYHTDCIEAAQRGWWHPQASGPCYTQAYTQHVLPAGKPAGRWNRPTAAKADKPVASGFKRKTAASAQEVSETRGRRTCSVHPGASHSDADCLSQRDSRPPGRAREASGDAGKQAATRR